MDRAMRILIGLRDETTLNKTGSNSFQIASEARHVLVIKNLCYMFFLRLEMSKFTFIFYMIRIRICLLIEVINPFATGNTLLCG